MPTWRSLDAFSRDLNKWAVEFERNEAHKITEKMGKRAQAIARSVASGDLGGDPKFSGWAPELDTRLKEIKTGHVILPTKPGAGPWTVAEKGRNVGETGRFLGPGATLAGGAVRRRKDGSVAKRGARKARRWNGVTKGKNTATKAVEQMDRELPEIAGVEFKRVLKKRFDVT